LLTPIKYYIFGSIAIAIAIAIAIKTTKTTTKTYFKNNYIKII
jgi:hypothetical protein